MREKLKKCPFCGGEAELKKMEFCEEYIIICTECDIPCAETGVSGETLKDIINNWNKRAV